MNFIYDDFSNRRDRVCATSVLTLRFCRLSKKLSEKSHGRFWQKCGFKQVSKDEVRIRNNSKEPTGVIKIENNSLGFSKLWRYARVFPIDNNISPR